MTIRRTLRGGSASLRSAFSSDAAAQLALSKIIEVMFSCIRKATLALALFGAIQHGFALAGSLAVNPLRIDLKPDGQSQVLRLRSNSGSPALVKVEAVTWAEPGTALEDAPRAHEILAVPPIFTIEPGGEQVIRLGLRQPTKVVKEGAYRILITEVPGERAADGAALALAVRLNLPAFVTPEGAEPDPVWALRSTQSENAELVLANRGNAHVRVKKVEVIANDFAPVVMADRIVYVLAGQERSWPLDLKSSLLDGPLTVKAETNLGPLEAVVALEGN